MDTVLGLLAAAVGLGVSIYFGRNSARQLRERASARRFVLVRQAVSRDGLDLRRVAGGNRLALTRDGWLLDTPRPLADLVLELTEQCPTDGHVEHLRLLRGYLPTDATGRRFTRFHEAVSVFDRPALWFDAATYRLLGVERADDTVRLTVGPSRYWDCFDFAEGLKHEAAHHYLKSDGRRIGGRFRRSLADPFDFARRQCGLGFCALTIRAAASGATFYLHRRGGSVAVGQNETSLVPAGEFQPSDDSPFALRRDLDVWFALMREYGEEFLGIDEVREANGAPIDYDNESPFREMQVARRSGGMRPHLLGVGLDPVTWKGQIYLACVFEAATFDALFAGMVTSNLEGTYELPSHRREPAAPLTGWAFDAESVASYLGNPRVSPSAKLVIELAWRHRRALLA